MFEIVFVREINVFEIIKWWRENIWMVGEREFLEIFCGVLGFVFVFLFLSVDKGFGLE